MGRTKLIEDLVEEPLVSDEVMESWAAEVEPATPESAARYAAMLTLMLEINKECGVFQDVEVNAFPEEHALANSGKYMTHNYGFGSVGHRSDSNSH